MGGCDTPAIHFHVFLAGGIWGDSLLYPDEETSGRLPRAKVFNPPQGSDCRRTVLPIIMASMILYDLCLPWYWEYDDAFVGLVERACVRQGKTLWQVTPTNLLEAITALYKGEVNFRALLDRAQGDIRFEPINRWAREYGARRINPTELSLWSEDKATMHLELIEAGLNTPQDRKSVV